MAKVKKTTQAGISEAIRVEIAKIPANELVFAKPARVLSCLEAGGIEITASARSTTSKLLTKAKKNAAIQTEGGIMPFDSIARESQEDATRRELAMRLVEACGGENRDDGWIS